MGKISGPLLDRIDLHIEVPAVAYQDLRGKETGATSAEMRERVLAARAIQMARGSINATVPAGRLRDICPLDDAAEKTLEMAVRRLALSARARPDPEGFPHHRRPGRERADPGQTYRRGCAVPLARPGVLEIKDFPQEGTAQAADSTGYPPSSQASNPPRRAAVLGKPASRNFSAKLALDASFGQVQ
jgi:hypothetical protein